MKVDGHSSDTMQQMFRRNFIFYIKVGLSMVLSFGFYFCFLFLIKKIKLIKWKTIQLDRSNY